MIRLVFQEDDWKQYEEGRAWPEQQLFRMNIYYKRSLGVNIQGLIKDCGHEGWGTGGGHSWK